jgi:hypothetical protein
MTHEWLCELITSLEDANGFIESSWIEFKSEMNNVNVAEAVGALANADGGLVIVGVLDAKHAKAKRGGERVVGLPHVALEKITSSLLSAFGRATPEVRTIPVAGNPDLVTVVILVDPDRFQHPVVVHGKVKLRIGSDSINADRDMIERLVDRNRATHASSDVMFSAPMHLSYLPYWDEDNDRPFAAIRLASSMILGRAVLEHQVIPSDVIDIAKRVMNQSLLPTALWFMGALFDREVTESRRWNLLMRSARQFRLNIEPKGEGPWPEGAAGGGIVVTLNGQRLDVSTTMWFRNTAITQPLVLSDVYKVLLALFVTTHDILKKLSAAMVPNGIAREGMWGGAIQPEGGQTFREFGEIIDFDLGNRVTKSYTAQAYVFPDFRLREASIEAFDQLVRLWLDIMFADCGVIEYENALAAMARPFWYSRFVTM